MRWLRRALTLLPLIVLTSFVTVGASAITGPSTPTNLEVVGATEDTITLAWGPAQPGEFYLVSTAKNAVTVGWGASQDTRSAVTYTLSKNGVVVVSGLTGTSYRLTGIGGRVSTFRTCVTALNAAGQASPPMCATWNRS